MDINIKHTQRININGLEGRNLKIPSSLQPSSKRKILLIYGVHSSMERMYSTAEFLSDYGEVTMPDLPGIGGMTSFYDIGIEPSLDNYADYLYSFMKVKKLDKNICVVAMSFGFLVITRMLQKHPDAQKWISDVISFVGFGQASDFNNIKGRRRWYIPLCTVLSTRLGSWLTKRFIFNPVSLRFMFWIFRLFNPKYKHGMKKDFKASTAMELDLWQKNDTRTRFYIYKRLFTFDLTSSQKINTPLHNLTTSTDQYFDSLRVKNSLSKTYSQVTTSEANMPLHAPSIIGTKEEVTRIFSDDAKRILER